LRILYFPKPGEEARSAKWRLVNPRDASHDTSAGRAQAGTSAFDRFVGRLKDVRQTAKGVRARCPAHEDSDPSLDVDHGDDGRVLVNCRSARCSTKSIVAAVGLTIRDLFPQSDAGPQSRPQKNKKQKTKHPSVDAATKAMTWAHQQTGGTLTQHYDYFDAAGNHVMRTMRFDYSNKPKQFGQAHRTEDGSWVNGGMPEPRPLFRLPELIAAGSDDLAFVPEGEKCALACAEIGLTATTSSQGSQAPTKTDWSPLRDRDVVILPDQDKSGWKYRDAVVRLLDNAGARSIAVLELDDLKEGDDVFDWIHLRRKAGVDNAAIRSELLDLVAKSARLVNPQVEAAGHARPQIEIVPGQLREMVDKAEAALLASPHSQAIYQRGSQVVRVARIDEPASPRHGTTPHARSPMILTVGSTYLRGLFESSAQFVRMTEDGPKPIACPSEIPSCYLQSAGHWRLSVLRSIVCAPTLRDDGSVLQEAGYDQASALLYDPCGITFRLVPENPTKEEAQQAASRILSLVSRFDFVNEGARSVWLACVLTAVVRPILPTAPMFVIDAPTRGSGKSKLANAAGIIATGRPPATMSLVDDVDETRKRILALLIQGSPVINIDNVDVPIGGAAICTVLTEQSYSDRILGASEIVQVPTTSTWIATGNNVVISGDMTRRVLVARLDPNCERPEDRKFDFDPVAVARQNRAEFVVDALTILRAHAVAGRPQCGISPFGSFELWSEMIRAAIVWLGLADPILGRQSVVEQDGGASAVADMLRVWHAVHGDRELTTRQVLNTPPQDLLDAIDEVIGSDVAPSNRGRHLGQVLAQWRDRIVGGYQAVRGRDAHGGTGRWAVHAVSGGNGGNGGNGWNPGANGAGFSASENWDQQDRSGERPVAGAKAPTVPTVPTIAGSAQPDLTNLPIDDVASGWTAGPDDGMPEQPGRRAPKRSGGMA
jgi:putative DNA primase/helicase